MATRPERVPLQLRIVIRDPVPGVALALQSGRFDLVMPTSVTASAVTFDFAVEAAHAGSKDAVVCYGPFTQGPPTERFVYVTVGTRAGQPNSPWERRAKIPLLGITPELLDRAAARPGSVLEVSFGGTGRDGSPACATVKLPPDAWKLIAPGR